MKAGKKQLLITLTVFLVMIAGAVSQSVQTSEEDVRNLRERTRLVAAVYAQELEKDFQYGIAITESIEDLLIDSNGLIQNFSAVAERRMESYVESIQLAPNGAVSDIYPLAGNEAGMIDLMNDPARGPIVQYGKEQNLVTMQGPFDLKQGGQGVAIRNPVFLNQGDGASEFWGFTIVIIRLPKIYEQTLNTLASFGYDYCLDTAVSPLSPRSTQVAVSREDRSALSDGETAQFIAGGCTWTLNVIPQSGWVSRRMLSVALIGSVISLLVAILIYMLIGLQEQRKQLKKFAVTDALTGLLSRRGFMDELYRRTRMNPEAPMTAVFIDLDDFKQINDLYGHFIGDEALKSLARNLEIAFPKDAVLGRTGGDEFCVLLCERAAEECSGIIRKAMDMDQTFLFESKKYSYTISAGYADYPLQTADADHLLELADQALYISKATGKQKSVHYDPSIAEVKQTQFTFSVKSIAAGIPGAFMICSALVDEQILFANNDLIKMTGCEDYRDFLEHTGYSFRHLVHPDDIDRVEESRQALLASGSEGDGTRGTDLYCSYKIKAKSGAGKRIHSISRLMHTEHYGNVFFVFIREHDRLHDVN